MTDKAQDTPVEAPAEEKEFDLLVTWSMAAHVKVKAASLDEAIDNVENGDDNLPTDGEYVSGSFEVDKDLAYGEETLEEGDEE